MTSPPPPGHLPPASFPLPSTGAAISVRSPLPHEARLRQVAGVAALVVCALAAVSLAGTVSGVDPLEALRTDETPMPAGTALGLLLAGVALWCQRGRDWPRAGLACAVAAGMLAAVTAADLALGFGWNLDFLTGRPAAGISAALPRTHLHTALVQCLAALAIAGLGRERHRARPSVSAWLANLVIALAVAGLLAAAFREVAGAVRPIQLGTHAALALILLGVGTVLARPQDTPVRLLLGSGTDGVLIRWLFFGTAAVPVILTPVLLALAQSGLLSLADGMMLLFVGVVISGFAIALLATAAVSSISQSRDEAEQARASLTARLQEQAARLQEIVAVRTQELSEANSGLRAAAESNALLALVAEHTTNAVIIADANGLVEWVNAAFTNITGYALAELKGRKPGHLLLGPDSDPATIELLRHAQRNAQPCHVEVLNYTKAGHPFWLSLDLQPVRDRHGKLVNFIALANDITDERAAQHRLHSLNERLALATRAAALGVWEWDARTARSQWDARTLEIYGLAAEDYHGTNADWVARVHPDDRDRMVAAFRGIETGGGEFEHEFRIVRACDGAVRHIESRGLALRDAAGRLLRVTGTERDVTAERDAAQQSATLNERLRLALRSSNYGVWELDVVTQRVVWDERMFELYGVASGDYDGSRATWRDRLHPEDRERAFALDGKVISGEVPSYDMEFRIVRPDGALRHIEAHGYLQRDAHHRPLRLVGLNRDITTRKLLEERVRKGEELAAAVATLAQIGGWEYEVETRQLTWNDGTRRIHEVDADFQPSLDNTRRFYPPEALETLLGAFDNRDPQSPTFDYELPLVTAAGNQRWVRVLGRTEFRADGQPVRVHGAIQDISARHESDHARRELETQLFQAQKMETLGTLAGGIAHDFNNLLTGIIGYHELAADSLPADHPARSCLAEARNASLRARELVEQILTFGRQSPGGGHMPLQLGAVAEEARRFLRSTLSAMISLELHVEPDTPAVLGDATQIYQVLLNLGSNAAHAMRHHGGTLTIDVATATLSAELRQLFTGSSAGTFVRLSVRDTGHGMDEATRRRIFDPFFTTKNTREGTGLGLAVVHGIVRAHRGAIDVESKPGAGAAFHIYLPAATSENELIASDTPESPCGAGEFICVVDDEEVVGSCTRLVLESKGYTAVVYRSAEECLAATHGGLAGCALLVTDQTMPGMQGTELVATVRKSNPSLPVVIMSGYFSKISPDELKELGQIALLAKPFTTDELTNAVHRALHPAPARA